MARLVTASTVPGRTTSAAGAGAAGLGFRQRPMPRGQATPVPVHPGGLCQRVVRRPIRRVIVVSVTLRYELHLTSRLPQTAIDLIRSRLGPFAERGDKKPDVLTGTIADQSALRALLALIWDSGVGVQSVAVEPDYDPGKA